MKDDVDHINRLADYLYDDLEPDEAMDFERMISENPELAESYQFHVRVRDYLKAKIQLEEMRSDPSLGEAERLAGLSFNNDSKTKVSGNSRKKLRYIPAAAAVIVILVIIRLFIPSTTPATLFEDYYRPLSATGYNQRGETSEYLSGFSEAIDLYNQGAYDESIRILHKVESVQNDLPEVALFQGLNHMGLEQFPAAKDILADYVENNSRLLPEAYWYLSLCYLKTGEYAKCRAVLSRLKAYDGMYAETAQDLESKLRRIK